ncbi:hypothetical protein M513_12945 [Trichuris suis]|nr:hypothetical protein M513_12945 [Trichuris suis]
MISCVVESHGEIWLLEPDMCLFRRAGRPASEPEAHPSIGVRCYSAKGIDGVHPHDEVKAQGFRPADDHVSFCLQPVCSL